jgi:flagellar biosynthesis protein FlhA
VPIRDIRTIAENLTDSAAISQDIVALTASVRTSLSRLIVQEIYGSETELPVMTLDPQLEQLLLQSFQQSQQTGGSDGLALEPGMAERLQKALEESAARLEAEGRPAVLLVAAPIRPLMAKFVRYGTQQVSVLSYQEIPENKQVTIVASVGG